MTRADTMAPVPVRSPRPDRQHPDGDRHRHHPARADARHPAADAGRHGPKPIPAPPADELRRLYVDKRLSRDDLAARYHVSEGTARRWLRDAGIRRTRQGWAATVTAERLRALYVEQGLSTTAIAARQGVAPSTVWNALVRHGIPRRPTGSRMAVPPAAELRDRYLGQGWSIRRLAAHYRVSYPTARGWLVTAGIALRPRGGHRGAGRQRG